MIDPEGRSSSRSHVCRRRGVAALVFAAGFVALACGTAQAQEWTTRQLEAWGPQCRAERDAIIPPNNEEDEVLRQKQDLFNACMANGGHLPGEQSSR
jgi:hypothetical protein